MDAETRTLQTKQIKENETMSETMRKVFIMTATALAIIILGLACAQNTEAAERLSMVRIVE